MLGKKLLLIIILPVFMNHIPNMKPIFNSNLKKENKNLTWKSIETLRNDLFYEINKLDTNSKELLRQSYYYKLMSNQDLIEFSEINNFVNQLIQIDVLIKQFQANNQLFIAPDMNIIKNPYCIWKDEIGEPLINELDESIVKMLIANEIRYLDRKIITKTNWDGYWSTAYYYNFYINNCDLLTYYIFQTGNFDDLSSIQEEALFSRIKTLKNFNYWELIDNSDNYVKEIVKKTLGGLLTIVNYLPIPGKLFISALKGVFFAYSALDKMDKKNYLYYIWGSLFVSQKKLDILKYMITASNNFNNGINVFWRQGWLDDQSLIVKQISPSEKYIKTYNKYDIVKARYTDCTKQLISNRSRWRCYDTWTNSWDEGNGLYPFL